MYTSCIWGDHCHQHHQHQHQHHQPPHLHERLAPAPGEDGVEPRDEPEAAEGDEQGGADWPEYRRGKPTQCGVKTCFLETLSK